MSDAVNYYQDIATDPRGLHYRLDGADVIEGVIDRLKGGYHVEGGKKVYHDDRRMMNEEGIRRVEFFLAGCVTKISHLTKFANEARVMTQLKELARSFVVELSKNIKVWAPDAELVKSKTARMVELPNGESTEVVVEQRVVINPYYDRVRNPEMVVQVVENAILSSYQRGIDGFEANNLGKSWQVSEMIGRDVPKEEEESKMRKLFGGRL